MSDEFSKTKVGCSYLGSGPTGDWCTLLDTPCAKSYCTKLAQNANVVNETSGHVRSSKKGLGRPTLIPNEALRREAIWYEGGAVTHGDRNWELGEPFENYLDSIFRHWLAYKERDSSEDHLAAIRWNAGCLMHHEKHHPELDNRPVRE